MRIWWVIPELAWGKGLHWHGLWQLVAVASLSCHFPVEAIQSTGEIYKPLVFDGGIGEKTCGFLRHFHWYHGCFLANHQIESVTVECADLAGGMSCGSAGHVKELRWGSYRHRAHVIVAVGCGCACNGKPIAAKKLQDPRIGNDFAWYPPP